MTSPAFAEDRFAAPAGRREQLTTAPSPTPHHDYVVTFAGRVDRALPGRPLDLRLRYVPDRRTVDRVALERYLDGLGDHAWPSLEAIAAAIVDDVNNEAVPRWVSVTLSDASGAAAHHAVLFEDRQPGWDNPALLARLEPA